MHAVGFLSGGVVEKSRPNQTDQNRKEPR